MMLIKHGKILYVGSPTTFEVLLACEFQKSSASATESYFYNTTKRLISLSPGPFSFASQRAGGKSLAHLCLCECAPGALQRTLCSF